MTQRADDIVNAFIDIHDLLVTLMFSILITNSDIFKNSRQPKAQVQVELFDRCRQLYICGVIFVLTKENRKISTGY